MSFHKELVEALESVITGSINTEEIAIKLSEIKIGMTLSRNVVSKDQVVLLSHDTEITLYLFNLLQRFEKLNKLIEPIYVWKK